MGNVKKYNEFLNEAVSSFQIKNKDWERMLMLVLKDDDGERVANQITDKSKAIVRFVAGLKLGNNPLRFDKEYTDYSGYFSYLGNKALSLGATPEEIQNLFDVTEVPDVYIEKLNNLSGKKFSDRFVGDISKTILDLGFDITYLPCNGYALTSDGKDAMERNGRKWTIGYKSEIELDSEKYVFNIDAITDEGDGPTAYIVDARTSDKIFSELSWRPHGKLKFINKLKEILNKQK